MSPASDSCGNARSLAANGGPRRRRAWHAALLVAVATLSASGQATASTFTVNSTADAPDAAAADGICATAVPGQCTLRAAIQTANATAAGAPHTIAFAVPAGQLTAGVAQIAVVGTDLPAITRAGTTIDGATMPETNPGLLGTGGTVGVDALPLPQVPAPEVEITDGDTRANGLTVNVPDVTIRGVAIVGFGTNDILVNAAATNTTVTNTILGARAGAWADPGAAARSAGRGLTGSGASSGRVTNNLIGWHGQFGVLLAPGASWTITGNEVRRNAMIATNLDGISMEGAGSQGNLVEGNLSTENGGVGIDSWTATGRETVRNNTVTRNGIGTAGAPAQESAGIRIYGTLNDLSKNIVADNFGAGVMFVATASSSRISQNAISGNGTITGLDGSGPSGQIGIDLHGAPDDAQRGTAPFVTPNDPGDGDTGANDLLNFPVIESAVIDGTNLVVTGWARPGVDIELFRASIAGPGFGQGRSYIATFTEGAAADLDPTASGYSGLINGVNQGTDTTNRFRVVLPVAPTGLSGGEWLTATATAGGTTTSEFSGNAPVVALPVDLVTTKSGPSAPVMLGSPATFTLTITNRGPGTATAVRVSDALPAGLTDARGATDSGSCTAATATVTCDIPSLAAGATARIAITATATQAGVLTNRATVGSAQVDTSPADNTAEATVTVVAATLALTIRGPAQARRGDAFVLRVAVTNTAASSATNVVLRIVLPRGITLVRVPPGARLVGGVLVWPVGQMAPGQRVARRLVVRMGALTRTPQRPRAIARGDNVAREATAQTTVRPFGTALPRRTGVTG